MSIANQQTLERKIRLLFPDKCGEIVGMLSEYGREEYERESIRVRLAILKLSDGNHNKVKEYIEAAKKDYRDVLAWAEYPEAMENKSWELSAEKNEEIRRRDRKQLDAWLKE